MPADPLPPLASILAAPPPAPPAAAGPAGPPPIPGFLLGQPTTPPSVLNVIVGDSGRGFAVDLSRVTKEAAAAAAVPPHAAGSRADAAISALYNMAAGQARPARPPAPERVVRLDLPAPAVGRPEVAPLGVRPPPAAPRYVEQAQPVAAPLQLTAEAAPAGAVHPRQQVTFEVPGYGPLEAYYHQVIRAGEHLVLVYDRRYAGPRAFPRHSPAELAARVHGTDRLFGVRTTGVQFDLGDNAVCVLRVTTEAAYSDYQAAAGGDDPLAAVMAAAPFPESPDDGEDRRHPPGGDPAGDAHDASPGF